MITLDEYNSEFRLEALLIKRAKYYLLENDTLDGFTFMNEETIKISDDLYSICVYDKVYELEIKDNMIVGYNVS